MNKTTFEAYNPTSFDELWKMCVAAARSSFFRSIEKADDAFVLFTWAQEHGVPVSEAWANCFQINGAVVVGVHLQTAMILRHPELVEAYEIRESTPRTATFYGRRAGGQDHEVTFTWDDAMKAFLHEKNNYQRHPADMLLKMAKVRVHRALWADILGGAVYDADEMSSGLAPPPPTAQEIAKLNEALGAPAEPPPVDEAQPEGPPTPKPAEPPADPAGEDPQEPENGGEAGPAESTSEASAKGEGEPEEPEPPHDPETGEIDPSAPASKHQKDEVRRLLRESGAWGDGVHWRVAWRTVDEIIGSHVPPAKLTIDLADTVIVELSKQVKNEGAAPPDDDAPPPEDPPDEAPPTSESAPQGEEPTIASRIRNGNGPEVFWARAVRAATDGATLEKLVIDHGKEWLEKFEPKAMAILILSVKTRAIELDRPDLAEAFEAKPAS